MFGQIFLKWKGMFFTSSNAPKSADDLFHCKTEIFDHLTGKGDDLSKNKHPIVQYLGAAAWSFCLTGCVHLPGKQYLTGLHPGTIGWPGVHGQNLDSWWESITCERYGGLQVQHGHWTSTSKCRWGKIRCPHDCSYQDSALIYCKQSLTPVSQYINHMV